MMYKRLHFWSAIVVGAVIIGCIVFLYLTDFLRFFSLETLQCHARDLMTFTYNHYWLSVILYLLICISTVMLFLPVVTILMIAGGFLFGPWQGAAYGIIGATIGAIGAFTLVRRLIGPWVTQYEARLVTINKFIKAYDFYALLLLRMSHLIPFFLLNIAAALMPVSVITFTGATFFGVIPGALLFAWTGQYLCSIQSVWDLFSFKVILIAISIASAVFVILVGVRWLLKHNNTV